MVTDHAAFVHPWKPHKSAEITELTGDKDAAEEDIPRHRADWKFAYVLNKQSPCGAHQLAFYNHAMLEAAYSLDSSDACL